MDVMKYKFQIYKQTIIVRTKIKGINDTRAVKLILDTGATKTIIDEKAVINLGYDPKQLKQGYKLMTASGIVWSKIVELPKFSLFGKDVENFEVNVINMTPELSYFARGLIGMDFLLKFGKITFDLDENIIETS